MAAQRRRYLTQDGEIDWDFVRNMRTSPLEKYDPRNDEEAEVLACYCQGGEGAVAMYLAKIGAVEVRLSDDGLANAYSRHLQDRYRQRSANGRGRRTHR